MAVILLLYYRKYLMARDEKYADNDNNEYC